LILRGYALNACLPEEKWKAESPAGKAIRAIRSGNYREIAAEAAGISRSSLFSWLERGRDHVEDDPVSSSDEAYVDFLHAVTRAERASEVSLVQKWEAAANRDWRAARELLARRHPSRWGAKEDRRVELSGSVEVSQGEIARRISEDPKKLEVAMALLDLVVEGPVGDTSA
jgi:hypothetical protein